MRRQGMLQIALIAGALTWAGGWAGAVRAAPAAVAPAADENQADSQADKLLQRGIALVEDRQEDRGIKLIASIPLNFPKSDVRFKAALYMGKYYSGKGEFQVALKNLAPVAEADGADPEERAESLYRMGVCHFGLADYNRALAMERRVTEEFPWSVFANEAYYYIGLAHFKLSHWRAAVEALKLVGTSVPPNAKAQNFVESGQRFFVKVQDKDLRVLETVGGSLSVAVRTESGDTETVPTAIFDRDGETYVGSIKTELGKAVPGDGRIQLKGGDVIRVDYADANTQEGAAQVQRLAVSRVVSTAVAGFMDGAYREYVSGVIAGQNSFLRVKDFDADVSDARDKVKVRVYSQYRVQKEAADAAAASVAVEDEPEFAIRDSVELSLEETEPHSGYFTSMMVVQEAKEAPAVNPADAQLAAFDKDTVHIEYIDKEHKGGLTDPRTVTARAEFLTGQIQDVWIAHREVSTEDLRARKNLIEARFYLRLAQIFRDVGLLARASEKADIGLDKIDDILRRSLQASIGQDVVEQSYEIRWELQLAKGDLDKAVATCRTLVALYPASSLADLALLQIARANVDAKKPQEAMRVLQGILSMKGSGELKAEAQFLIGTILEENAARRPTREDKLRAMGQAIESFKACADKYPNSPFAGQSLGKIVDFYIEQKDYDRSQELIQTVFQDFPDASFLDEMLLKWGVVFAQQRRYDEAKGKLQQLVNEYPNSPAAGRAQKLLEAINKKTEG